MPQTVTDITWEQFIERFKPIKNHLDSNASCDGLMFETFDEEYAFVVAKHAENPNLVWTYLDCDGGTAIVSGWHYVNRIGYFITELPATQGEEFQIFEPDEESDDES